MTKIRSIVQPADDACLAELKDDAVVQTSIRQSVDMLTRRLCASRALSAYHSLQQPVFPRDSPLRPIAFDAATRATHVLYVHCSVRNQAHSCQPSPRMSSAHPPVFI
jgi:hypothetical protein